MPFDGSQLNTGFAKIATVTPEEFRTWLEGKRPWRTVGYSFDGFNCPLACFMHEVRGVRMSVSPSDCVFWQRRFITLVDIKRWCGLKRRVSAGLARRLLDKATAGGFFRANWFDN